MRSEAMPLDIGYELDAGSGFEDALASEVVFGTDEPINPSLSGSDIVSRTLIRSVNSFVVPFTVFGLREKIADRPNSTFRRTVFAIVSLRLKRVKVCRKSLLVCESECNWNDLRSYATSLLLKV